MSDERLINATELISELRYDRDQDCNRYNYWYEKAERDSKYNFAIDRIEEAPTVDAVPVDEFKLHYIIIDNEGVPEIKLQFGDRFVVLRTDPVDVREVVHGRWIKNWCNNSFIGHEYAECSVCDCHMLDTNQFWNSNYCPNCGARMDAKEDFE